MQSSKSENGGQNHLHQLNNIMIQQNMVVSKNILGIKIYFFRKTEWPALALI